MTDSLKALARKGAVTIVEHTGGKTIIAIELSCGNIISLEGGTKEQLLTELCRMVRNWPDKELRH